MMILTHAPTGAAYALDGDDLIYTPMHEDLTFDTCLDNWSEVEETNEYTNGIRSCLIISQTCHDPEYVG